ncbi:MAG TPA: glucose-1-phosphate cytidylyltransferase [bacterium]|jgi:glucose-1-phosphate cytidylyltransferase
MKTVILAGGKGTRLSEETVSRPKPMVEIGGRPILWHIMKIYAAHGINEFIICLGYKGYMIKEYFSNYRLHMSDVTIDIGNNRMEVHQTTAEDWRVTLIDTGEETMTGGRLKRIRPYLNEGEPFCMTYGDGVGDIDITALLAFHRSHNKPATLTATQPPGRFGSLRVKGHDITSFVEKPDGDQSWINGGFFVVEPSVLGYVEGDDTIWERAPLERLAAEGNIAAYKHTGFWLPMDTLRDKMQLEQLWQSGKAPWKVWA